MRPIINKKTFERITRKASGLSEDSQEILKRLEIPSYSFKHGFEDNLRGHFVFLPFNRNKHGMAAIHDIWFHGENLREKYGTNHLWAICPCNFARVIRAFHMGITDLKEFPDVI